MDILKFMREQYGVINNNICFNLTSDGVYFILL